MTETTTRTTTHAAARATTRRSRKAVALLFAAGLLALPGCTVVKPWDRDMLSRQDMAFDADPLETSRRNHVYFSKEATPPGGGAGGGGCGCN